MLSRKLSPETGEGIPLRNQHGATKEKWPPSWKEITPGIWKNSFNCFRCLADGSVDIYVEKLASELKLTKEKTFKH